MPQMAPISWLSLFFIFFITFIMFNMMNYFNYFSSPSHHKKNFNTQTMNWKW